ncbi:hypothetical protein WN944_006207 [Citrus x changshan-huyou]|uniref:NB-ARC domain-containing protein n=1 Tax=Citrus x changshan-huyou TaxID=2935761 RepID=A0AAP0MIT9_9ROSI
MALLDGLHSEIIDIRSRMQQLPPGDNGFDISEKSNEIIHLLSEGQPRLDINEFERGREELFDLLIEGHPRLAVVTILDSSGFDKTAFAEDTYNNNHVKFYFDRLAWVRVPVAYDFRMILDDIIKSVMPPSRVSEIIGEDYQLKRSVLRDYLTNKKYFIVLDDVFGDSELWDDLEEVLPDDQNGSRVLILVTDPQLLALLEMENGEKIRLDSVLIGGPLIRLKHEAWQLFILHYGKESDEEDVKRSDILEILKDINHFVHESEEAIDTFFINIMQQQNRENESDISEKSNEIIDIRNRTQQLPPGDNGFDINEKSNEIIRLLSEGQPRLDISEFERGREKFFDLLIEGPSGLSVVAILDSSGFDKTAFAAHTYNSNHVKFYFDCLAWVRVSLRYDYGKILDGIIKSVMPPARVRVIIGEDYQLKKSIFISAPKNYQW